MNQISGGLIPAQTPFALDVSFDVPSDVGLPAGTIDTLDISMSLGTNGSLGSLRLVARVNVNHTTTAGVQVDLVQLDLSPAGLLYVKLDLFGGISPPSNVVAGALNALGFVPLLPVPVNRGSTSPTDIIAADIRIIDDTSGADLDDSALLLTFGGDAPGNRNGFVQGLVPPGDTGAIGISFDWLCNIIRPHLAAAMSIPAGDFDPPCHLNTPINLPGDHNPQLTALDLNLVNGALSIGMTVSASDTGWNATATAGGSVFIAVQNGNLIITSTIADPQINVNLDWWVWLAAAVVGAIIGGIIAGVIGAIIGAILVPLITWLASNLINGIIQNIADQIVNALRSLNLNVNVPAIGINLIFQDINIDDVVIGSSVQFTDNAPIRSQGEITVYDGQRFDLDNGTVGNESLAGADMLWTGEFPQRSLRTLCCDLLARTSGTVFDLTRSRLYRLYYESGVTIPEIELGTWSDNMFWPSDFVYSVITDEGRFSLIQVIDEGNASPPALAQESMQEPRSVQTGPSTTRMIGPSSISDAAQLAGYITVRYRTFEKPAPQVNAIQGLTTIAPNLQPGHGIIGIDVPIGNATFLPLQPVPSAAGKPGSMNPGVWTVTQRVKSPSHATIGAVTAGMKPGQYRWSVNQQPLEKTKGSIKIDNTQVRYEIADGKMRLEHEPGPPLSFGVTVTTVTKDGNTTSKNVCVETGTETSIPRIATTSWPVFQKTFLKSFGYPDP